MYKLCPRQKNIYSYVAETNSKKKSDSLPPAAPEKETLFIVRPLIAF